jgi:hypothetical protein
MTVQLEAFAPPAGPIVPGVPTTQRKPTRAPWWYEVAAREQLGVGEEWEVASLEAVGPRGDTMVSGNVTTVQGKQRTWVKPLQKVIVTAEDVARLTAEYEVRTWVCGGCGGDGLQQGKITFIPAPLTYEYRTCSRCGGSGKPKAPVGVQP